MLGGGVGAEERRGDPPADRGDRDDPARRAFAGGVGAEQREHGLCDAQHAEHVDREVGFKILQRLDAERAHPGDAGIVDEAGQAPLAQSGGDDRDGGLDLLRLRHVQLDRPQITRRALFQAHAVRIGADTGEHGPALCAQVAGGGIADPGGGAGDQNGAGEGRGGEFGHVPLYVLVRL